jgi:uncharacterized C2H2 Zn-finger protein
MSFECKYCNYSTNYSTHYKKHTNSKKHQNVIDAVNKLKISSQTPKPYQNNRVWEEKDIKDEKVDKVKIENKNDNMCPKCNMILSNRYNLTRHVSKCKVHSNINNEESKNMINNNICLYCKITFSKKQSLSTHMRICSIKNTSNEKLQHRIEILEEKLKAKEEIVGILTEQNKNTNTLAVGNMCNVNGMIETNMRSITFLNKFMTNAPCLEHFNTEFKDPYIFYIDYDEHKKLKQECKLENSKDNILYYDEDKMTKDEFIADHILFLQRNKQTVKFIVERLLYFYKKEGDTIKQSIWNIDMYRYNFTVCLKTGNKTIWHSDKQGQTTTEMILDPLLSFTSGIVQKHIEVLQEDMQNLAKQKKTNEMLSLLKKIEALTEFTLSVKNKELHQEIIRKLSPLMFFDPTKHKEILQIEE